MTAYETHDSSQKQETKTKMFAAVHPEDIDSYGNFKGVRYSWTVNIDEGEVFMVDIPKVRELWGNEIKGILLSVLQLKYYDFYICTATSKFSGGVVEYLLVNL